MIYSPLQPSADLHCYRSTYTVITVTITGIETIWLPTIDYLVWEPTQTSAAQFFLPNTTIVSNHTTIANKRHVLPRATILALPPYATACSSSAAYLSACSCIGVHATRSPVDPSQLLVIITQSSHKT
jgi:hypothetical protein